MGSVEVRICLNLGCGTKPRASTTEEQWINIEMQRFPGVNIVRDLRRGLPFNDSTVSHVLADNVLEHLNSEDSIFLINEIDRVLIDRGTAEIVVPRFPSPASVQDPGHKSFYTERSALYWNNQPPPVGTPYGRLAGFTSNLVAYRIDRWGSPDEEQFLRFNLRKESET